MRITLPFVVLFLTATATFAQQPKPSSPVNDQEFQNVLEAVSNEEWNTAVELSAKSLKQMNPDDERLPLLRYIYLYSAAGKVSEGGMEFDELAQSAKEFVGKNVVLPYRPITMDCRGAFNFICGANESKTNFMVAAANKTGTTILAFEYVKLKEPFDFAKHVDEPASVVGRIENIVPNPNKSRMLVMRLFISDAIIKLKEQPSKRLISSDRGASPFDGKLHLANAW